jgi:uncharacterized protein YeaC (DUF1315 family)
MNKQTIVDWFDVTNPEHVRAWHTLCETGCWPEGFVPESMKHDMVPCWQVSIAYKLANAYVSDFLARYQ